MRNPRMEINEEYDELINMYGQTFPQIAEEIAEADVISDATISTMASWLILEGFLPRNEKQAFIRYTIKELSGENYYPDDDERSYGPRNPRKDLPTSWHTKSWKKVGKKLRHIYTTFDLRKRGMELTRGNTKLGRDTFIMNMSSATDCPSARLSDKNGRFCQLKKVYTDKQGRKHPLCYALRAEVRRKVPLDFRRRQDKAFHTMTAKEIADQILAHLYHPKLKPPKPKYLRISESGDFLDQNDVNKLSQICEYLKGHLKCYVYTARRDLNFHNVSKNLVVNASGFTPSQVAKSGVHNVFQVVTKEQFKNLHKMYPGGRFCGDRRCIRCDHCKVRRGAIIYQKPH